MSGRKRTATPDGEQIKLTIRRGVRRVIAFDDGLVAYDDRSQALTGTPARLRELVASKSVDVRDLKAGETTE
jgi:hypothetical protein